MLPNTEKDLPLLANLAVYCQRLQATDVQVLLYLERLALHYERW